MLIGSIGSRIKSFPDSLRSLLAKDHFYFLGFELSKETSDVIGEIGNLSCKNKSDWDSIDFTVEEIKFALFHAYLCYTLGTILMNEP